MRWHGQRTALPSSSSEREPYSSQLLQVGGRFKRGGRSSSQVWIHAAAEWRGRVVDGVRVPRARAR
ncbi:hypothetical protein YT1_2914 [Rhodococcus ruber]|nr:hypothetical protein YT1_2914 [Rhodococcus ruber]